MAPAPVDRLEILVVVDNYADALLPSEPGVERPPVGNGETLPTDTLLAEHGLCLLLTAHRGASRTGILLDAGYSPVAAPRNLKLLREPLDHVESLVISHGHEDHVGAVDELLSMAGRPSVVVHPDAFLHPRFFPGDDGRLYRIPEMLIREGLTERGVQILDSKEPVLLGEGAFLVTGEIPRATPFERALPGAVREVNGRRIPDPVPDDQGVVIDVAGLGLIVVSGCAHAGIVNTVRHARRLVPGRPLHTVLGGFHLSGSASRDAIAPTIEALRAESPKRVVPMHCTGIEAKARMREAFGDRYAESAVGTRFTFPHETSVDEDI